MKIRYFFLVAFLMLLAVGNSMAQAVQEKTPVNLQGVWQMCFYRSNSPDIPGELKTSNSLKILSDDGRFINLLMMQTGAVILGYGTYEMNSEGVYTECVEKNVHLPQLNGKKNEMHFDLKENGTLMYVKYFLESDANGNKIDSWCNEIWKKGEMSPVYPGDELR